MDMSSQIEWGNNILRSLHSTQPSAWKPGPLSLPMSPGIPQRGMISLRRIFATTPASCLEVGKHLDPYAEHAHYYQAGFLSYSQS